VSGPPFLTLTVPPGPSSNRLWKSGKKTHFRTDPYKSWLAVAIPLVRSQARGRSLAGHYALRVTVPRSARDLGNYEKALSDMLQAAGVVADDKLADEILAVRDWTGQGGQVILDLWHREDPPAKEKTPRKRTTKTTGRTNGAPNPPTG
jgi:Holliday junction resolvase RusA-like endonuclease